LQIKKNIFSYSVLLIFLLSLFTEWYGPLTLILFFLLIIHMLNKLGKGIVLREIIALHTSFICLVMPLVGYTFFDKSNHISKLWLRYMPIPLETYFGFALPAIAGFIMALFWPSTSEKNEDSGSFLTNILIRAKEIVQQKSTIGVYLLAIGPVMLLAADYAPSGLDFVFRLFYFAAFAGFLYVYYTRKMRFRKIFLWGFALFILMTALSSGMFTVVAYMGLTLFSFLFLGKTTALWKKLLLFILGSFILLLVQSVKPTYRRMTWKEGYTGSKLGLFSNLLTDKLASFNWDDVDAFFPIYYRTNQGYNVALVMRRFPVVKPYDNGYNILISISSALVPRLLWPDKPEAGGKFNMQYYTGVYINGWSTNVGPLGEAYGSFGPVWGVAFMIFLGLFLRWFYRRVLAASSKTPLLLFWFPVLFYQITYSAETDTLQIFNSLVKASFFIWALYRIIPAWFVITDSGKKVLPRRPAEGLEFRKPPQML